MLPIQSSYDLIVEDKTGRKEIRVLFASFFPAIKLS
jgi:hypothetical protein